MTWVPDYVRQAFSGGRQAPSVGTARAALNFADPYDNLYAFGKLWAGYDAPVVGAFHGLMFAMVGNQRLQPLFGYCGFGIFEARREANGNVRLRGKEVGYFSDPRTGDILESWDNPFTGETVKPFNFLNDRIRGELGADMPRFEFGDGADTPTLMNEATATVNPDGSVPFILPWETCGDRTLLSWDYTHRYRNPVTPAQWPMASTGEFINPSEHFTFSVDTAALEDRSVASVDYHCGFSRLSPWWPWMRMGQSGVDGVLFGRMHSHKSARGFADVPAKVLAYTEKHYPDFLEPPGDWDDGFPIGTWEAYARDVAPEVITPVTGRSS